MLFAIIASSTTLNRKKVCMRLVLPVGFCFHDNITVTEAAVFIPEVWANRVLETIYAKNPTIGCVLHDYSEDLAQYGDEVHIQKRGTMSSHSKTANNTVTLNHPTGESIPVTLSNHRECSFLVEDVAEAQANVSVIDGYTKDAASVLSTDIEDAIVGLYASVNAARVITWDPTSGATKLASMIAARKAIVVTNKCPEAEPRYCIVKDSATDFLDVDKFTSKEYLSQNSLQTGTVGEILGFNVKEASQIVEAVSPTQTHRLVFAKEAIALVTRKLPDVPAGIGAKSQTVTADGVGLRAIMAYNADYLGVQVTVDILFGVAITRSEWLCELVESA
ncbi:MAG: hypothetical protein KBE65_23445 [Phycisphaerae bacterium]|nr:hypothetical protein [Phycisphaerae bacterium]